MDSLSLKLSQAQEDAARQTEKAVRQEKHRFDRQQLEFEKTLRQRDEDFGHQLKQREQELSLAFDARLTEDALESANHQVAMHRHGDAPITLGHSNMRAGLSGNREAQPLQGSKCFGSRDVPGKLHA